MLATFFLAVGIMAVADNALVVHTSHGQVWFPVPSVTALTLDDNELIVKSDIDNSFPYQEIVNLDFAKTEAGDVNGDGIVDIVDVNTIINIMLSGDSASGENVRPDVNGDGRVDVVDINAVINMMLGRHESESPEDGDRMLVHRAGGLTDVFIVDSVKTITFVEVPEAGATITLIDVDESSIRARVTKSVGTQRYEVACYRADEAPDDVEAFIQANKKFTRKANGAVEFIDLIPSTHYVVAALTYDEFDLPCEVSTLEVATADRVISEPAQVGDYLYSDGSWSTELKSNKTPVGIVYSIATTEADKALGYTNGYAVALTDAIKSAWTTEADENESGSSVASGMEVADREGLTRTRILLNEPDHHPAAKSAHDYAAAPYGTSEWFLPAAGQWVELMANLGGLDANAFERSDSGVATWNAADVAAALAALNARLASVGQGKYAPLDQIYYWSASERSVATAYYLYLNANYNMSLQTYYKDSQFAVRPMIAF